MPRFTPLNAVCIAALLSLSSSCKDKDAIEDASKWPPPPNANPVTTEIGCKSDGIHIALSDWTKGVAQNSHVTWKATGDVDVTIAPKGQNPFPFSLNPPTTDKAHNTLADGAPSTTNPPVVGTVYHYTITATCPAKAPNTAIPIIIDPDLIIQ